MNPNITNYFLDLHIDAILRAGGSSLRNYSMQKPIEAMRDSLRAAIEAAPTARSSIYGAPLGKPLTAVMDNVLAWRLGESVHMAMDERAGDFIDRGLILLALLNAKGFEVFATEKAAQPRITQSRFNEKMEALDAANPEPLKKFCTVHIRWPDFIGSGSDAGTLPSDKQCTCPTGDGSLTWPCPVHPPGK